MGAFWGSFRRLLGFSGGPLGVLWDSGRAPFGDRVASWSFRGTVSRNFWENPGRLLGPFWLDFGIILRSKIELEIP